MDYPLKARLNMLQTSMECRGRMKFSLSIAFAISLSFVPLFPSWSQELPPPDGGQTVSGNVINISTDEEVHEPLEVMLHSWAADGTPGGMLHGITEADGAFAFENVILESGSNYAAMVVYKDVAYYSQPAAVSDGKLSNSLDIGIYETTSDVDKVHIGQLHIFLEFRQGGLMVAEVYAMSNLGNRTVAEAIQQEDGNWATIEFSLPSDAANVAFPSGPAERFELTSTGFTDTQPLTPGEGSGQVVVMYVLPYKDDITLQHALPFDAQNVVVFVPHASGLNIEDQAAQSEAVTTFGDGKSYEAFTYGPQSSGELLRISVSGSPSESEQVSDVQVPSDSGSISKQDLALGVGVLGASLVIGGIWWWWREGDLYDEHAEAPSLDEAPM
jgi:hypothetical protein